MHSQTAPGLIELTTLPNEAEAGIIQSVLADAGIESWTQKAPGFDFMGLVGFGFTVTTITVRAEDADRARAALDTNRQDSVDLDWSEVNVGEPEDQLAARFATGSEPERALGQPPLAPRASRRGRWRLFVRYTFMLYVASCALLIVVALGFSVILKPAVLLGLAGMALLALGAAVAMRRMG